MSKQKIKLEIIYWIILASMASIMFFSFDYLRLKTSDYSNYFTYTSLTSSKEIYLLWEDLIMTSDITREKPLYMIYSDILKCQLPWEHYTWFSSTLTYSKKLDRLGNFKSVWRYEWDLPRTPALCYIDSYPTVLLDYWIKKTQNIKSNTFLIIK